MQKLILHDPECRGSAIEGAKWEPALNGLLCFTNVHFYNLLEYQTISIFSGDATRCCKTQFKKVHERLHPLVGLFNNHQNCAIPRQWTKTSHNTLRLNTGYINNEEMWI